MAGLIADAAGDLFGTTDHGGANGAGTVFEIAKTSTGYASSPTVLASFDYDADGSYPQAGLIADAAGNLFGTTYNGGVERHVVGQRHGVRDRQDERRLRQHADCLGELQRRRRGRPTGRTDRRRGRGPFRHDGYGGTNGDGTVFEIAKTSTGYASTPTVLASFNGADGVFPCAGLIADAAGDLFGTTEEGGAYGDGTVFEIAKTSAGYASTPTVLASFDGADGAIPSPD